MVEVVLNTIPELMLGNNLYQDETFTAGGANTYPAGLILARLVADDKLVIFNAAGSGGAEIAKAILRNELITTGAGDSGIRPCISGTVRSTRLLVWNAGTPAAPTVKDLEQLRDFTLVSQTDTELLEFDNAT